jgi:hypothetical protein
MIQSPLYQEIVEEAERKGADKTRKKDILRILRHRFGDEAEDLGIELNAFEYDGLEDLFDQAMICPSLADFRERLLSG